jgi:hypothetical protein
MAHPYSVRFLIGYGDIQTYVVPNGYRAIVRCVTASHNATGTGYVVLRIGSYRVFTLKVPEFDGRIERDLHVVLFAGETLQCNTTPETTAQVAGYLLDVS